MCPPFYPGCDRFPADYALVAPERSEIQLDVGPSLEDFPKFFATQSSHWLWYSFARPVEGAEHRQNYHRRYNAKPTRLEQFPNELLDIIIGFLGPSKRNILTFGLSSVVFWPVVLDHIHAEYRKNAGLWAGAKVTFLGARSKDCPGAFEDNPEKPLRIKNKQGRTYYEIYGYRRDAMPTYVKPSTTVWLDSLNTGIHWSGSCVQDWIEIEQDLSCEYLWPQDRVWVLRNLTTKEYVRSDRLQPTPQVLAERQVGILDRIGISKAIKTFRRSRNGKHEILSKKQEQDPIDDTPIALGQVFLLLTCFSTAGSYANRSYRFERGHWAGDRFDLVTLDNHLAKATDMKWKDISEPAVNDVANLRCWIRRMSLIPQSKRKIGDQAYARLGKRLDDERWKYHHWKVTPWEYHF